MAKLDDDDRKAIADIVAAELKAFADEQARRNWAYKNTALEKGDAYQILRDTRDAVMALKVTR